jgi:hypothetical protein
VSGMGAGQDAERGGDRHVGERSRRWPDGRPLCGAKKKREEGFCSWTAGQGTSHLGFGPCERHGGNLKSHVVAAQRAAAELAVKTFGLPIADKPAALALLDEFAWILGHVAWLRDRVQETDPEALVWGKQTEDHKTASEFPGVDTKYLAAPSVWLELYHRYHRLLLDYGKTIESLNLDKRKLDMAQEMGVQFGQRIQVFIASLHLSAEQVALVPSALEAMRAELTADVQRTVAA